MFRKKCFRKSDRLVAVANETYARFQRHAATGEQVTATPLRVRLNDLSYRVMSGLVDVPEIPAKIESIKRSEAAR